MPKASGTTPKYCKHKASGQAVVTLSGKDFYLGPHGTAVSKREYDRLVGEWMAAGRSLPNDDARTEPTITEICLDYIRKADQYYRKNGKHTNEYGNARSTLKELRTLYGSTAAKEFGPIAFKAFRQRLIDRKLRRTTINHYLLHVIGAFRYAVENEKLPVEIWQSLKAVERLRKGRSNAPESRRIKAVDDATVEATLPHLPVIIADMVRLQRATAMRPMEVCLIRPGDVDRSRDVWIYIPHTHKTEHHGRPRIIPIGTIGQRILAPYLLRSAESYCFSPAESVEQQRRKKHLARTTPLSCGNRPGTNRKRKPKRTPGICYSSAVYGRCIADVCEAKIIPHWAPNQLRKLAATNIRKVCDLEAAQVILGHQSKSTTEGYYADPQVESAIEVDRKIG
jgi:integrase